MNDHYFATDLTPDEFLIDNSVINIGFGHSGSISRTIEEVELRAAAIEFDGDGTQAKNS